MSNPHTREGLMADAQWFLLFLSALSLQLSLLIAVLNQTLVFQSTVFVSISLVFAFLAFIPTYWSRFFAMFAWTGAMAFDFYLRHNLFSIFFLLVGLSMLYKMVRFRKGVVL